MSNAGESGKEDLATVDRVAVRVSRGHPTTTTDVAQTNKIYYVLCIEWNYFGPLVELNELMNLFCSLN